MGESDFNQYVDSLQAVGATYHDMGLLWGARVASPTGIFGGIVNEKPSNGGTVSRHMIFMTDGELAPNVDINTTYGIESIDRRITGDGRASQQLGRHRSRFLEAGSERLVTALRMILVRELPPQVDPLTVETLDLLLSWESWARLRREQGLSPARARQVLEASVRRLLA